jgi:hypothetical protein
MNATKPVSSPASVIDSLASARAESEISPSKPEPGLTMLASVLVPVVRLAYPSHIIRYAN